MRARLARTSATAPPWKQKHCGRSHEYFARAKASQGSCCMSPVTPSISSTVKNALVEVWGVLGSYTYNAAVQEPPSTVMDVSEPPPTAAGDQPQPAWTGASSGHQNITPCDASITNIKLSSHAQHRAEARRQAASSRSRARRYQHPHTRGTHPPAA